MNINKSNFKTGVVSLRVTDADDLWYLSHIIEVGDLVKGKTTRKMKIGDGENAKTVKKTITLTIEAETVELTDNASALRINGKIRDGPEEIANDIYHAISLMESSECTITKPQWLAYHKQRLTEASEQKYNYLVREEALFAVTKKFGFDVLVKLSGEVPKKSKDIKVNKDFHEELIKALETYNARHLPESIIIASPAFYKDELIKKIKDKELKKKIVLAICSSVQEQALDEVLKRPELAETLKTSRAREEQMLVEELLKQINKNDRAAYGEKDVQKAIESGAVQDLLMSDKFVIAKKEKGTYKKWDDLLKSVDAMQGGIHLISSEYEGGQKVDGLGGVAAILRYKLN